MFALARLQIFSSVDPELHSLGAQVDESVEDVGGSRRFLCDVLKDVHKQISDQQRDLARL